MDSDIILILNDTNLSFNESEELGKHFDSFPFRNSSLDAEKIQAPYFGDYFKVYYNEYLAVHGYLSYTVCVFGIITNILNITVLTRKNMVSSINAILTALAVADILQMFSYVSYAYHYYIVNVSNEERLSYGWTFFKLFFYHCSLVNYAISTWLTVTVAVWRYIAVRFPLKSASWCSMTRAKYAVTATYATCAVFFIPNYISFVIAEFKNTDGKIVYYVQSSGILPRPYLFLKDVYDVLFSVVIKLVPCVALTALSLGLIRSLDKARKIRKMLKNREETHRSENKITKMLLVVVLLFLITQFPQGLLFLLTTFLKKEFNVNVYLRLGETMDALSLINSSINFIIYCSMSSNFRDTFSLMFVPKFIRQQEIVSIATSPKTSIDMCTGESYKIKQNF